MTTAEILSPELTEKVDALRAADKPFAFATIVRTVGSTAAKPGAKALLAEDGTILEGWLGGGCARGAVKASRPNCVSHRRTPVDFGNPRGIFSRTGRGSGHTAQRCHLCTQRVPVKRDG